jgi:endonuclease/exonuclease/phosphatase family metal-dependent hydrolase
MSRSNNPEKRKNLAVFAVVGLVLLVTVLQAYTAQNYTEEDSPFYSGNYASDGLEPVETLTVISYNIWFGDNIDQALSELREIQTQRTLDIILLQEMDEIGVEQIARELQMNYVYFPAAIEPTYDENFGNAILSRWPILDPQKLILPHKSLSNRMNRIATRATVQIQGMDILVYSIHTESVFTLPKFKRKQYTAILQDMNPEAEFVIIGGDFNSFTETAVDEIEKRYQDAGISRVSKDGGYSVVKFGIGLSTDHIFAKGFMVQEAGTLAGATASDHLPIWVTMTR